MKFWTLFLVLLFSCIRQELDKTRIESIGQSLIKLDTFNKTESSIPDIVFLGEGLIKKISQLKTKATKFNTRVEKGDFKKPFGNNQADCILTIQTDIESIGIRLKYNKNKDKYDILGWMTLTADQN
jgi:primosomal protein N''